VAPVVIEGRVGA